jgi:predicted SprT family Zn-dependent metalloprotease
MSFASAVRHFVEQLSFDFVGQLPAAPPVNEPEVVEPASVIEVETEELDESSLQAGPADDLVQECRQLLLNLGMENVKDLVKVDWNPQLRSTAGYARYPSWQIELNPRLIAFDGQVQRTLLHELAHLVAYHRAGRRRIKPHGPEWQKACADLGIRGEPAHHRLPLPRNRVERQHAYQCPSCTTVVRRVRPFTRPTACLKCCNDLAGGKFDTRFKFVKIDAQTCPPAVSA